MEDLTEEVSKKIHFPKGEGIKIIQQASQARVPDTIYIRAVDDSFAEMIVVSKSGSKRRVGVPIPENMAFTDLFDTEGNVTEEGSVYLKEQLQFQEDIVVSLPAGFTFGKYKTGDVIPATGKTANQVIRDALRATLTPTLQAPSAALNISDFGAREVGSSYTVAPSISFDRGGITGKLVGGIWKPSESQGKRAGAATDYVINGTSVFPLMSKAVSGTTVQGDNTVTGSVSYEQGMQPLDSEGAPFGEPLPAGTINLSRVFQGLYNIFYGAAASTHADMRTLPKSTLYAGATNIAIDTGTAHHTFYIVVPAAAKLNSVIDTDALNLNITSNFVLSNVMVKDAAGVDRSYKLYKMTNAAAYPSSHNLKINIS